MSRTHAVRRSMKTEEAFKLIEKALHTLGFRRTGGKTVGKWKDVFYRNNKYGVEIFVDSETIKITSVNLRTGKVSYIELKA